VHRYRSVACSAHMRPGWPDPHHMQVTALGCVPHGGAAQSTVEELVLVDNAQVYRICVRFRWSNGGAPERTLTPRHMRTIGPPKDSDRDFGIVTTEMLEAFNVQLGSVRRSKFWARGREAAHEVTVAYTTDSTPALRATGPLSTSARIGDGLNLLTMR
jgi:hypothetical protein